MRAGNGYSFFTVNEQDEIVQHIQFNPKQVIPTATIPPFYPLFLFCMYTVFGDTTHVILLIELLQAVIGAVCCIVLYRITAFKFSKEVAIGSSIVFCLYPLLVYLPGQISAANMYIFLNLVFVYCLLKAEVTKETGFFYIAGLVFGVLLLTRSEIIAFFPVIILWIIFVVRKHPLHRTLAFTAMIVILLVPWVYRNYRELGAFIPLTTQGGYNLWQGQNPDATGTRSQYTDPPFHVSEKTEAEIQALKATDLYEIELNKIYLNEAHTFIKENPVKVVSLALRKFMFFWGHYWGIKFTYPGAASPFYWLPWFLLLPFFIISGIALIKDFNRYSLFYVYFIMSSCIVMIFFVIPRYRLFILPLILPFAVNGIRLFVQYVRNTVKLTKGRSPNIDVTDSS